jgi:hypothetical protein
LISISGHAIWDVATKRRLVMHMKEKKMKIEDMTESEIERLSLIIWWNDGINYDPRDAKLT